MQANYSLRTHYSLAFILSAGGELRFPWIPRVVGRGVWGGAVVEGRWTAIPWLPRKMLSESGLGLKLKGDAFCLERSSVSLSHSCNPFTKRIASREEFISSKLNMLAWTSECPGDRSSKDSQRQTGSQQFLVRVYLCFLNSRKITATRDGINQGTLLFKRDKANMKERCAVWVAWSQLTA